MSVKVVNKLPAFVVGADVAIDMALANVAAEGARLSVLQAPHLHGRLWSSNRVTRKGFMKFEVSYNTPYARRWEYTTPARGFSAPSAKSHYLQDPLDLVTSPSHFLPKLKVAAESVRV